jgi:MFS family permease
MHVAENNTIDSSSNRGQLLLLGILAFASTFSTAVVFPNIGSFVRDRFILSATEASLFAVAYLLPHVVFAFIWGAISDRIGKRRLLLVFGYVMTAVFHFTLPFISSYPLLLFVRIGEGAFSILGFSMVMTIAVDIARKGSYGRVMGTMGAAVSLGTTLAFPVGGAIGSKSMLLLCSLGALILLLCAGLAQTRLKEGSFGKARSIRDALLILHRRPALAISYAFTFVDRFTVGFFAVTFPLYVGSRIGGIRLLLGGSVLYGIVVFALGLASPAWFWPVMILCGLFAASMYAPSLWLVAHLAPSASRASAMGGFNAVGALGFAVGPMAGAVISDLISYPAAFMAAGVSEILCVLLLYPLLRRYLSVHEVGAAA